MPLKGLPKRRRFRPTALGLSVSFSAGPVAAIEAMRAPAAASAQATLQSQPADPQRGTMLQVLTRNYADVRVTPDVALMVSAVWSRMF